MSPACALELVVVMSAILLGEYGQAMAASVTPTARFCGVRRGRGRRRLAALALSATIVWLTGCTAPGEETVILQLRWCVMEGSSEAGGAEPGELVSTHRADGEALAAANEIWADSNVGFVSVVAEREGVKGVPVIADPDPNRTQGELDGDIDGGLNGADTLEPRQAAFACDRAWRDLDARLAGPVIVTVRRWINSGPNPTLGGTSAPELALWVGGSRGDDLCGHPRGLVARDVYEIDGSSVTHVDVGWSLLAQPTEFFSKDHRIRTLAHELGHLLFLSHGNGRDDNGDGEAAGTAGPRRFDGYCDPLGSTSAGGFDHPVEDSTTACVTIMDARASCRGLTPLQIEQARAAAAVMPGCRGVPCKED